MKPSRRKLHQAQNEKRSGSGLETVWFSSPASWAGENCTTAKTPGGAETVQKRCSFAALCRSGTKTGPFLVRYRGAVPVPGDIRTGADEAARVKLTGAGISNGDPERRVIRGGAGLGGLKRNLTAQVFLSGKIRSSFGQVSGFRSLKSRPPPASAVLADKMEMAPGTK